MSRHSPLQTQRCWRPSSRSAEERVLAAAPSEPGHQVDEPSEEQYRAAVSASPQDVPTLDAAMAIALRTGQLDDAKDYLRKILARRDEAPEAAAR